MIICRRQIVIALVALLGASLAAQPSLRVVVIEGEDAVNIIQQKTAVRPVVEVRDRNNLPVPGALVTFSIEGGKAASFGGASTLTVATNAAGQAAVTGLTPATAGAFQIQVSAAFQGQLATATITQTNVMTAAQAAAAGAATGGTSGSSAGSGGGAAGGGGGLSGTTIAVAGAAVAGGALAAVKIAENVDFNELFTGSLTGQIVSTGVARGSGFTCTSTYAVTATVEVENEDPRGDNFEGELNAKGVETLASQTCAGAQAERPFTLGGRFTGTDAAFSGTETFPFSSTNADGTSAGTFTVTIEGSRLDDATISVRIRTEGRATFTAQNGTISDNTTMGTFVVGTLRKANQ